MVQQEHEKASHPEALVFHPAAGRGTGSSYPDHEIINQLNGTLTTTSTGRPRQTHPPAVSWIRTPSTRMPIYEIYCTKYAAPASPLSLPPRPTSKQATQRNQQNKNYQTDPTSPNRSQISILQRSPDPAPQQGHRDPRARHGVRLLPAQQTMNPARSRPACRQPPTQPQPQTAKIELPNRPNLAEPHRNQRFSQHPALTCRVAIPGDISYPHNRTISRPRTRRQSPNRHAKQTQFPKTSPDPHLTATCP